MTALAMNLWAVSKQIVGLNTDPKMFSVMLFKRLWGNHRGFLLLWNDRLQTEADIVLRAGLEAAICIAANAVLRDNFITLAREDLAATLKRQIKMWADSGSPEMVQSCKQALSEAMARLPDGANPKAFDWKSLAAAGGVPLLYTFHKGLSGGSSHVTGLSLIRGAIGAFDKEDQAVQTQLEAHIRISHLMMMIGATLLGCKVHADMIGASELAEAAGRLTSRLNLSSSNWADDGEEGRPP